MYTEIVNPKTGRKISVKTKLGQNIIRNYLNAALVGGKKLNLTKSEKTKLKCLVTYTGCNPVMLFHPAVMTLDCLKYVQRYIRVRSAIARIQSRSRRTPEIDRREFEANNLFDQLEAIYEVNRNTFPPLAIINRIHLGAHIQETYSNLQIQALEAIDGSGCFGTGSAPAGLG